MKQKCDKQTIEINSLKVSLKVKNDQCQNCAELEIKVNQVNNEINCLNKSKDELKNEKDTYLELCEALGKNNKELEKKCESLATSNKSLNDFIDKQEKTFLKEQKKIKDSHQKELAHYNG